MNRNRCVAITALVCTLLSACASRDINGERLGNQAPTVWLAAAPPEGSVGTYTVHLYWGGWDPDGEIAHYEYLVTDNTAGVFSPVDTTGVEWTPVVGNDSTFTFSADLLVDSTTTQQVSVFARSHTFFIRSVDLEGRRSEHPAYRSFTARTLSPRVTVNVPVRNGFNPADMPPIATFRWSAADYVNDTETEQEPDSVQYAFVNTAAFGGDYVRTIDHLRHRASAASWHPWVHYKAPGDSGRSWTTPPQAFGNYVFAVRAKDEARSRYARFGRNGERTPRARVAPLHRPPLRPA